MTDDQTEPGASRLMAELIERAPFPITAMIELTRRCNLRCIHCFLDLDGHRGQPTQVVKRWLDELAEEGVLFLCFTGGELLLRDDWLELSRYARAKHFALRFKTNATKISEDDAKEIASLALLSVDVSLYAAEPALHDEVTGVPGSWTRSVAAIERLRSQGVPVRTVTTIMEKNAGQVRAIAQLSEELGCTFEFDPGLCGSLDPGRDTAPLVATQAVLDGAIGELVALGSLRRIEEPEEKPVRVAWACLAKPSGLYIRADGELRRCPSLALPFGSVLDQPIGEVWRGSTVRRELEERARQQPARCRECSLEWACSRCAAHAMLEHGTLDEPAAIDCHTTIALVREALARDDGGCNTPGCETDRST